MNNIIQNLKGLDLSKKPQDKIKEELNKIGGLGFITTTYHKGKEIERAVNNTTKEPIFNTKDRISYTPLDYIKTYQRATIPNSKEGVSDGLTVFYGGVLPEDASGSDLTLARIIAVAEACPLIRDSTSEDKESLLTFGKWRVKEDLNLLTIVDPAKTYKLEKLNELVTHYKKKLEKEDKDVSEKTKKFLSFISSEFSKYVNAEEPYNYMISALFTEMVLCNERNKGRIDGIVYPSVQTAGDGLCVAILPSSMHKLELIKVLQSKVIKKGMSIILEDIKFCNVTPPNSDFDLKDI